MLRTADTEGCQRPSSPMLPERSSTISMSGVAWLVCRCTTSHWSLGAPPGTAPDVPLSVGVLPVGLLKPLPFEPEPAAPWLGVFEWFGTWDAPLRSLASFAL